MISMPIRYGRLTTRAHGLRGEKNRALFRAQRTAFAGSSGSVVCLWVDVELASASSVLSALPRLAGASAPVFFSRLAATSAKSSAAKSPIDLKSSPSINGLRPDQINKSGAAQDVGFCTQGTKQNGYLH